MDLVGGKLLGSATAASHRPGASGMMTGEIAPLTAPGRFEAAMHHAQAQQVAALAPTHLPPNQVTAAQAATAPVRVAQVTPTTAGNATAPTVSATTAQPGATPPAATPAVATPDAAGAQERARRALDLAPAKPVTPATATNDGDRILDGLTRLRGVFDTQQGKLINAMNQPVTEANGLIGLQVEVINFSMLVDVASKLTGKSTGALETLMKGQ